MAYPRGYAVELGLVYSSQSIDIPMLLHPQSYGHLDHQYWHFYNMATMVLTTKMIPDTGGTELPPVEKHMSRFSFPSRLCMSLPLPALPLAGSFSPFIVCLNAFAFGKPSLVTSSSRGFVFPSLACFLCDFYHYMSLFYSLI